MRTASFAFGAALDPLLARCTCILNSVVSCSLLHAGFVSSVVPPRGLFPLRAVHGDRPVVRRDGLDCVVLPLWPGCTAWASVTLILVEDIGQLSSIVVGSFLLAGMDVHFQFRGCCAHAKNLRIWLGMAETD